MMLVSSSRKPKARRSPQWPALRKRVLAARRRCAACGSVSKLEVHHIRPVHLFPHLELVESNLLVLCESRKALNCHLLLGHLGDYHSWNKTAVRDAAWWRGRMASRPGRS